MVSTLLVINQERCRYLQILYDVTPEQVSEFMICNLNSIKAPERSISVRYATNKTRVSKKKISTTLDCNVYKLSFPLNMNLDLH